MHRCCAEYFSYEACLVHKMQLDSQKTQLDGCLYCLLFVSVWIVLVAYLMLSSYKLVAQPHVISERKLVNHYAH